MISMVNSASAANYDILLRHGTIYDGSGRPAVTADLAISGDSIAAIGDLGKDKAKLEIDATGLAVAPGFINMLSWATDSLLQDGRSQSDIRQGVDAGDIWRRRIHGAAEPGHEKRQWYPNREI